MRYRNWKNPKTKRHSYKNKKTGHKTKDEMKSAIQDDKKLKRKGNRLTLNWFFRPRDD